MKLTEQEWLDTTLSPTERENPRAVSWQKAAYHRYTDRLDLYGETTALIERKYGVTEPKSNAVMIGLREAEETEVLARLKEIRDDLRRLRLEDCPIKPGDVVKVVSEGRRHGKLYRVTEIDWPEPMAVNMWLWANPQLKSGAWSKGVHRLFGDFEKVPQP